MSLAGKLGNFGPLPTLEHDGHTYKVSYLGQSQKAAFEDYLRRQAIVALQSVKVIDPDSYPGQLTRIVNDSVRGLFSFHGDLASEFLGTPAGVLAMACILFGIGEDEMLTLMAERAAEVSALVDTAILASLPAEARKRLLAERETKVVRETVSGGEAVPNEQRATS